ncbi:MAG: hypothetical protein SGBAC_012517 [Bacillariaceae sp.]
MLVPMVVVLGGRTGDAANRARGRNLDGLMDAWIGPFYEDEDGFLRRGRTARANSGSRANRFTSFSPEEGSRGRAGDPDDRGRINQGSSESIPDWEVQERRLDALQQDNSSNRNMVGDQNPFSDSSQSDDESNCDGDEVEDAEVNGEHERSGDEADAAVAFLRRQRQRRRALSMRILSRGADNDISPFLRRALSESVINARRRYTGRENSGYPNSHFSSLVRRRALLENARGNNNAGAVGASVRRYVDDDSDESSIFPLPLPNQQSDDQQTSQNQSSYNNSRDEGIFNVARGAASFFGNFRNSIDGADV